MSAPHVSVETAALSELSTAHSTCVWLVSGVRVQVSCEVARRGEGPRAHAASVRGRRLPCVCELVPMQLGALSETPMTHVTLVCLVQAAVRAHVSTQLPALHKPLVTQTAAVRLRAAVSAHVPRHITSLAEPPLTYLTPVPAAAAAVGQHVSPQIAALRESLATGIACVPSLARVDLNVSHQVARPTEHLGADETDVRSFGGGGHAIARLIIYLPHIHNLS